MIDALRAAVRRRPWRVLALVAALSWIGVEVYQSLSLYPFDLATASSHLFDVVARSVGGVAGIAALVWLIDRSELVRRES